MKFIQGFVTAIAIVVLCGQAKNDGTLKLRKLEIVDEKGNVVGHWQANGIATTGLFVADRQALDSDTTGRYLRDKPLITVWAGDGESFTLIKPNKTSIHGGNWNISLGVDPSLGAEVLLGRVRRGKGTWIDVAHLGVEEENGVAAAFLHLKDPRGYVTHIGTNRLPDKRTGKKTITPATCIAMFDPKGKVIWKAPR